MVARLIDGVHRSVDGQDPGDVGGSRRDRFPTMQIFAAFSSERPLDPAQVDATVADVRRIVAEHPGLAGAQARSWWSPGRRTAVVFSGHPPARAVGVSGAWHDDDRMQILDGTPTHIVGPRGPDGPIAVADDGRPDGRFGLLEVDGDRIALSGSPIGSYALYARLLAGGVVAVGNVLPLLARIPPHARPDEDALEDLLLAGWVFGDRTVWDGIERLPPGTSRVTDGRLTRSPDRLIDPALEAAARPVHRDLDVGADLLRETVANVSRSHRGRLELGLSGGRDSRVILSAAVAAGVQPHLYTLAIPDDPAFPETGDVVAARRVASELGLELEVRVAGTSLDDSERWSRLLATGVSPFDATPSTVDVDGPTPTVLSGTAVEIGWMTYGRAVAESPVEEAIRVAIGSWVHSWPRPLGTAGSAERVIARGSAVARGWHEAGLPSSMVAEAVFAFERASNWGAPAHLVYAPFFETVCPGWSAELLPQLWSLHPEDLDRDRWRRRMIHRLCPEIERLPFSGGSPVWPDEVARDAYMVWGERRDKLRRYLRSRTTGIGVGRIPEQRASLEAMQREIRRALSELDPLVRVVDRGRVARLCSRPVRRIDPRSLQRLVRVAHISRVLAAAG
jgi:hypothetical protein